jgi:hypothetical protein
MGIVTAGRIGHAIPMGEGDGAFAQALEHHHVERTSVRKIYCRIEPICCKTRTCSHA